jgi:hypothetical protein
MADRTTKIFYLTDEALSKLRSSAPFSAITEDSQEILEEFLQTALGGTNRVGKKLLDARLNKARDLLSHEEQINSWSGLKAEIECLLSAEVIQPATQRSF